MRFSPVLVFHICAGTLGLLSGAVAMSFRRPTANNGSFLWRAQCTRVP